MKRPHMPLAVKLEACLYALGFNPAFEAIEFDHDPALELREKVYLTSRIGNLLAANTWISADGISHALLHDKDGSFYTVPDANNAAYIVPRTKEAHKRKTNGPGGEKRITTRGGDHGDAAHLRAVTKKEAEFRRRVLEKAGSVMVEPAFTPIKITKRKIKSRGFPKRGKRGS